MIIECKYVMFLTVPFSSVFLVIRLDSSDVYSLKDSVFDLDRYSAISVNLLNTKWTRILWAELRTRLVFEENIDAWLPIKTSPLGVLE